MCVLLPQNICFFFPWLLKKILSPGGGGADHSSQLVGHVCFVKDTKTRQVGTNGSPDPPSGMVEKKIIFAIPLCNRGVGVKKSRGLANTIKNKFCSLFPL